ICAPSARGGACGRRERPPLPFLFVLCSASLNFLFSVVLLGAVG
ncbi:unnamed protein product, partial [Brassica oleracea]